MERGLIYLFRVCLFYGSKIQEQDVFYKIRIQLHNSAIQNGISQSSFVLSIPLNRDTIHFGN